MGILIAIFAVALLVAGVLGAFIPVIPGPLLSYIGLLLMHWSGYGNLSRISLWVWAGITVTVIAADYILPSLMTKRFGGSRAAAIGSFLGLAAGVFFFLPWGMLAGSFLGAFFGELIHSRANGIKAFKVALGAFLAFIAGFGAKLTVSLVMLFFSVMAIF